jgi:hypothetical protein
MAAGIVRVNRRPFRPIQRLQRGYNRNAIGPLAEVIYEDFSERLGSTSFLVAGD